MSERYHLIKFRQLCAFFRRGLRANSFFQCLVGLYLTSGHSHPIDSSFLSVLMSLDIGGGGSLNAIARRQGNRSAAALPSPPFFICFLAEPSYCWKLLNICAIMFSLCNPQHGRGEKKYRSFHVCYIISAFLSPSLSTPDVPHLPSKALPGCTINSCFAAWHNKDYLHGDSSIAAERRVALSEF